MADPSKYNPEYSFSGYQASNPSRPLPAPSLDNELANIAASVDEAVEAIKDVRRSDGALKNGVVTPDSLSDDTRSLLTRLGDVSLATEAQAEAGTDNETFMSPLRTRQASRYGNSLNERVTSPIVRTVEGRINDSFANLFDYVPVAEHAGLEAGTADYDCAADLQRLSDDLAAGDRVTTRGGRFPLGSTVVFTRSGIVIDAKGSFCPAGAFADYLIEIGGNITDRIQIEDKTWFSKIDVNQLHVDGWNLYAEGTTYGKAQSKGVYIHHVDHAQINNLFIRRCYGNPLKIESVRESDFLATTIVLSQCNDEPGLWLYDTDDVLADSTFADQSNNLRFHGLNMVQLDASAYITFESEAGTSVRARNIAFYGPQIHHDDGSLRGFGPSLTLNNPTPVLVHNKSAFGVQFFGGNLRIPGNLGNFTGQPTLYLSDTADVAWSSHPNEASFFGTRFSAEDGLVRSINANNADGGIAVYACEFALPNLTGDVPTGIRDDNGKVAQLSQTVGRVERSFSSAIAIGQELAQTHVSNPASLTLKQTTGGAQSWSRYFHETDGLIEQGPDDLGSAIDAGNNLRGRTSVKRLGLGAASHGVGHLLLQPLTSAPASPLSGAVYRADGSTWNPLGLAGTPGSYLVWWNGAAYLSVSRANDRTDTDEIATTPTLGVAFGGVAATIGSQTVRATRQGRMVTINASITLSAKGAGTGQMSITGIPYNSLVGGGAISVGFYTGFAAGITAAPRGQVGGAIINLWKDGAGASSALLDTDASDTARIDFAVTYAAVP